MHPGFPWFAVGPKLAWRAGCNWFSPARCRLSKGAIFSPSSFCNRPMPSGTAKKDGSDADRFVSLPDCLARDLPRGTDQLLHGRFHAHALPDAVAGDAGAVEGKPPPLADRPLELRAARSRRQRHLTPSRAEASAPPNQDAKIRITGNGLGRSVATWHGMAGVSMRGSDAVPAPASMPAF